MTRLGLLLIHLSAASIVQSGCSKSDEYDVIPPLITDKWTRPSRGSLYFKMTSDGSGDIVLLNLGIESSTLLDANSSLSAMALVGQRPVYRYVAKDRVLLEVTPQVWDANQQEIIDCAMQEELLFLKDFSHDLSSHKLMHKNRNISTAGQTVLGAWPSPDSSRIAVLSAGGRFRKSAIPFADPIINGPRFHQVFAASNATAMAPPLKLDATTDRDYIRGCWSPDGRFLIYHQASECLWIIDMSLYRASGAEK